MSDPFQSSKRRIARAQEHIANIKSRSGSFFYNRPYKQIIERNSEGLDDYKTKFTNNIPDEITDLTYEAIEALRSSLDQAIHPIALACDLKRPDRIHFPIADDATGFQKLLKDFRSCPSGILEMLSAFATYKDANSMIWALNQVRRQSAHRLIVPVGSASDQIYIQSLQLASWTGSMNIHAPKWDEKKKELTFLTTTARTQVDCNIQIRFYIAFGRIGGLAGMPVIDSLINIASEVERVVSKIETETRRLNMIL